MTKKQPPIARRNLADDDSLTHNEIRSLEDPKIRRKYRRRMKRKKT